MTTKNELITGEELLDQFNSQPSDISSHVTLTEFIDRELQKAFELGQKADERKKLKEKALIMANVRNAIKAPKRTTNTELYMSTFGTGSTTAYNTCEALGLNPDSNETRHNQMCEWIDRVDSELKGTVLEQAQPPGERGG